MSEGLCLFFITIMYLLANQIGFIYKNFSHLNWTSLSHIQTKFLESKTSSGKRLIVLPDITFQAPKEQVKQTIEEKRYGTDYNPFDVVCPTFNGNPYNLTIDGRQNFSIYRIGRWAFSSSNIQGNSSVPCLFKSFKCR